MKKVIIVLLLYLISCTSDDSCVFQKINTNSIGNAYGCENSFINLNLIDANNEYLIITNESNFEENVTTNCSFEIDFDSYDLIIGETFYIPNDYTFFKTCENDNFTLNIKTLVNSNPNHNIYTFSALIEKGILSENSTIDISYHFIE